jgi:hypothetical protein
MADSYRNYFRLLWKIAMRSKEKKVVKIEIRIGKIGKVKKIIKE